jgi:hypothetical protein
MENTTTTNPELKFSQIFKNAAFATLKNLHKFLGLQILFLAGLGSIGYLFFQTAIISNDIISPTIKILFFIILSLLGFITFFFLNLVTIKLSIQSTNDSNDLDSIFDISFNQLLKVLYIYTKIFILPALGIVTSGIVAILSFAYMFIPLDIITALNLPELPTTAFMGLGIFTTLITIYATYLYFKLYFAGHLVIQTNLTLREAQAQNKQTMTGNKFKFFALTIVTGILIGIIGFANNLFQPLLNSYNNLYVTIGFLLTYFITQTLLVFKANTNSRLFNVLFNQTDQTFPQSPDLIPEPDFIQTPAPIATVEPIIPEPETPQPIEIPEPELEPEPMPTSEPAPEVQPEPIPAPELTYIPEPLIQPESIPTPEPEPAVQSINLADLETITPINPVIAEIQNQPIATPPAPQPPNQPETIPTPAQPEIKIPEPVITPPISEPVQNPSPTPPPISPVQPNPQTPPTPPTFQL